MPVTDCVCPSQLSSGLLAALSISNSFTVGFPAAAMNALSGVIWSALTCESGKRSVREQMPEGASQKRILWS
jgi:hypothetical protein